GGGPPPSWRNTSEAMTRVLSLRTAVQASRSVLKRTRRLDSAGWPFSRKLRSKPETGEAVSDGWDGEAKRSVPRTIGATVATSGRATRVLMVAGLAGLESTMRS